MKQNFKLIYAIVIVTIFGLIGGGVGEILTRVYILQDAYNVPMLGELNISGNNNPSLVIRDAKKVVVEQNEKIREVSVAAGQSIVGIFKRVAPDSRTAPTAAYLLDQETAQGFIITSDGWLITNFVPDAIKINKEQEPKIDQKTISEVKNNYVVVSKDGRIFQLDNVIYDRLTGYSFWHINARDLLVRNIANRTDIGNGVNALALNWDSWTQSVQVIGQKQNHDGYAKSSDSCQSELVLAADLNTKFYGTFLFNLNGDIIALIDKDGKALPIYGFSGIINSILKSKNIARPKLGAYYVNLADQLSADGKISKGGLISKGSSGIAIEKGSAAEIAGLKEGDIILSINTIEIDRNNDLCAVIAGLNAGEEVVLSYERKGEIKQVKIKLGS